MTWRPIWLAGLLLLVIAGSVRQLTAAETLGHRVLIQGNDRLAIIEPDGEISWEMKLGPIHDIHVLPAGQILVQQQYREIVTIDPEAKRIVARMDVSQSPRNQGQAMEVHAFQPLGEGRLMIAESGPGRIVEVDAKGQVLSEMKLKRNKPHPHSDTRLVRKLANGNYLVAHENDGVIREYESDTGTVVWDFEVPLFDQEPRPGHGPEAFGNQAFAALRLKNGNTLIATGNGHSVLEVNPEREIVWRLAQDDLDGIRLAWVTTLEVLPNGNYVLGNCHAGPGQPVLVEIEPQSKKVVWQLDRFEDFGNSVSNTLLLDQVGKSLR